MPSKFVLLKKIVEDVKLVIRSVHSRSTYMNLLWGFLVGSMPISVYKPTSIYLLSKPTEQYAILLETTLTFRSYHFFSLLMVSHLLS